MKFRHREIAVKPNSKVNLKMDFDPGFTGGYADKSGAVEHVAGNIQQLAELQQIRKQEEE